MSSRSSDILKSKPEDTSDKKGAETSSLSLTSISDRGPKPEAPKVEAKAQPAAAEATKPLTKPAESLQSRLLLGKPAAKADAVAEAIKPAPLAKPAVEAAKPVADAPIAPKPVDNAHSRLLSGKPAAPGEALAILTSAVNPDNVSQKKFEERRDASLGGRFQMGLVDNLKGQAEGITEIFYGKQDNLAELTSNITGQKTGSEHILVNLTKTTLNVGGVVKDLAADTIGVGDGKTKEAISKAVAKSYNDFANGSLADKMEFAGAGTGFFSTLLIGGGASAKGTANLATDVKVMRSLLQTEGKTASALSEAATGLRALQTTENVAAHLAPAAEDLTKVASAAAKTTVGPGRLAAAWEGLTTKASDVSRSLANTFALPGMEPALAGAGGGTMRLGGSRSALIASERTVAKTTTTIADETALLGRTAKPFVRTPVGVGGITEDVFGVGGRRVESASTKLGGGTLLEDASKGKSTAAKIAEAGPKKVELPVGRVEVKPPVVEAKPPVVEAKPLAKPVVEAKPPVVEAKPPVAEAKPPVVEAKPPVVEAKPPVVEAKPPVVEAKPPVVEAKPPVVEAKPPVVEAKPPVVEAKPPVVEAKPPVVEAKPPVVEAKPPVVEAKPPVVEAKPPVVEAKPPVVEAKPPVVEAKPPVVEAKPPVVEAKPPVVEAKPPVVEAKPPVVEAKPPVVEAKPPVVEAKPPVVEAKPPVVEAKPPVVEAKPPVVEAKPPVVEAKPPVVEAKPPVVEAKPPVVEAKPPVVEAKPPVVEAKPPVVEAKPPVVEAKPPVVEAKPPVVEAKPPVVEAKPPVVEAKPPVVEAKPPVVEAKPPVVEAKPPVVEAKPPVVEAKPPVVEAKPPVVEAKPPVVEAKPPVVEAKPPVVEAKPPVVEAKPPVVEAKPPVVEAKPPVVEAKPPVVEAKPPVVEAKPPVIEAKPPVVEVTPASVHPGSVDVALEQGTKSIVATGDDLSVSATRLGETTGKVVKGDLDEIARLSKELGKKGDDITTLANINERLATISRTAGVDVAEDIARTLKPALQKAEATALENSALKSAQSIEQRIARMTENLTGPEAAAIRENLQIVQTGTRQLAGKADDVAQVNAKVEQALRNLETTAGKSPLADDIALLARETRELQGTVNASSRLAAVENNSRILVSTGDELAREMGKLAPKVGTAAEKDANEIARLAQNLGKGGDDLLTVRTINEHIANISKTAGKEVADDVARALKPGLQKAENAALETNTLRSVSKIEQRVTRLAEEMGGPEAAAMRREIASIQQNAQKLIAGTDDAAATASIERSIANLEASGAKTKFADDIAKLSQDARELQSSVSVSRRVAAIENNTKTLASTGTKLGDDAIRLAADPLKAAAKSDLDEIARLGKNLGKGGDDVAAVTKINERLANISKTVGTDAAEDIARTLKPSLQKVESVAAENGALRSAANLDQRIARVAESVTGPEAAAIRQNLNALQQSTRGFVNSADNAAAHSEDISRALQTLERSGAKTNVAEDIAKLSRETRDMQASLNASRRLAAVENSSRALVNDGKALGDEVTRLANAGKAGKADLDEISNLSKNLGKTGDDLETIRKINDRVANITRTGGADAEEITRALTPKIQKAEQSALEASRLKAIDRAATTVEAESRNLSNLTRDLAKVADKTTPEGRALQQELKAIQRAADELPTALNPGTDATRLRTMVSAVEKTDAKLGTTAKAIDGAAGDLSALRTLENQTGRVDRAANSLRGTVAQVQDDLAAGTRAVKPGTEDAVRRALTTIDENTAAVQSKLGTTARVDREVREIRAAINTLEDAGQKPLAQQLGRQFRELDNANTVRSYEITSHQGPTLANIGYKQNLIAKTIDQVDRDSRAINAWGNLSGKIDVINDLQVNLQMLRYIARNDAKLMAYVEDTQVMVSRLELTALAKGGNAVERSWTQNLLTLAEGGNQQAINRLFVNGLQSDGWTMRNMANTPQTLMGRLGLSGTGRVLLRPEFWGASGRTVADATLTAAGLTLLYANYKYHSQLMLRAIEAQMGPSAPSASASDIIRDMRDAKKTAETKTAEARDEAHQKQIKDQREAEERKERKEKADLDFSPSVAKISRGINLSPTDAGLARLYGISTADPDAHQKVQDIIQTGKIRHWSGLGAVAAVAEEQAQQIIPVAESIRIKGPDGASYNPSNRPKTAVTSFSFTRAMELTNQIKLMTSAADARNTGVKTGTMTGAGSTTGPSLSQNLRTMVNFNSLTKTETGNSKTIQRREGTEEGGVDQAGSGVPSVPQGPQIGGMAASTVDPSMTANATGSATPINTANTLTVGQTGNSSVMYVDNTFVADESREAV